MKTEFRASFAKDLKRVKNKEVKRHVKDTIEDVERAQNIRDVVDVKKLRAAGIITESEWASFESG